MGGAKMNERSEELTMEEVNIYGDIDYDCGKIQYKCVTDCPFWTAWMSTDN